MINFIKKIISKIKFGVRLISADRRDHLVDFINHVATITPTDCYNYYTNI